MNIQRVLLLLTVAAVGSALVPRHELQVSPLHLAGSQAAPSTFTGTDAICLGLVLLGLGFFSYAVRQTFLYEKQEFAQACRQQLIEQTAEPIDANHIPYPEQGKLFFTKGEVITQKPLSDPLSGACGYNILKMERRVEVLEWRSKKDKCVLQWASSNSEQEGDKHNPAENWFIKPETFYNQSARLGKYSLSREVIDLCTQTAQLEVIIENGKKVLKSTQTHDMEVFGEGKYLYFVPDCDGTSVESDSRTPKKSERKSILVPGSLRLSYQVFTAGDLSIVAGVNHGQLQPYDLSLGQNKDNAAAQDAPAVLLLKEELCNKEEFFLKIFQRNIFQLGRYVGGPGMLACAAALLWGCALLLGAPGLTGHYFTSNNLPISIAFSFVLALAGIPLLLLTYWLIWLWFHSKVGLGVALVGLGIVLALICSSQGVGSAATVPGLLRAGP